MSIKKRLLLWLLSGLTVLGVIFLLADYLIDRALLQDIYDDQMKQIAYAIPLRFNEADLEERRTVSHYDRDDSILQIWKSDGTLAYSAFPQHVLPMFSTPGFSTVSWKGERWKVYIRITDQDTIQVAQSLNGRRDIAIAHATRALVPLCIFLLIIGLLIHWSVGKGLESLTQLSRELASRDSGTLSRLSTAHQPAELKPLTHALDTLLQRLGVALEGQRKFIADASHELRTPLATLQIQTQLVQQSLGTGGEIEALNDLKAGIRRTGHLVEQLLVVSRIEAGSRHDMHGLVALHEIVRQAVIDLLPHADARGINLGVERLHETTLIGSRHHLGILVSNLIDNAIRYTPAGGRVDVTLHTAGPEAVLEIEDSGPGIAPEERERVFDRFYRCLLPQAAGSGLGLAIVKQVADLHDAKVYLDQSRRLHGLRASVHFQYVVVSVDKSAESSLMH
ncbi:MAG TPA: ATP-binding protein [Herbaspirillum sp.]|jgi:two-component system OmpR family sensor kinase